MIKKYNGEDLAKLEGLYLIDFYADWCGPCKMMSPILEQLKDINIIKINVDENEELAKKYKVMSIPNMFLLKDGKVEKQLIGFHSKEDLEQEINNVKR